MFSKEARYIGLDSINSKAHFGYETPDTLYYSGPVWPVPDASIDFILCTETLEHIPDPSVFLNEASRCLKPNGRVLLTVPLRRTVALHPLLLLALHTLRIERSPHDCRTLGGPHIRQRKPIDRRVLQSDGSPFRPLAPDPSAGAGSLTGKAFGSSLHSAVVGDDGLGASIAGLRRIG